MRSFGSDPSFAGFVLDPLKCSKLSMEEKRDLVYELSKWTEGAPELLQSWSRRDLLEILCLEMGKERKYTGLTKYRIIENLLKIVSENKCGKLAEDPDTASPLPTNPPLPSKRQRKNAHPSRVPVWTSHLLETKASEGINESQYCQNIACRATMSMNDVFCKRCSCYICHKYDDNKDPSLWLVCRSEASSEVVSCGMSCHLECALKHEKTGITRSEDGARLDGSFYCVSCGKVNDLLGCWRKQLCIAKDARRVDILCYRVSLSHKLLNGTEKFQNLHEIVDLAVKRLEADVGAFYGLSSNMARGIVNRLSSGAEVQKLCTAAVTSLDSMLSSISHLPLSPKNQQSRTSSSIISFQDVSPTCLSVAVDLKEHIRLSEEVEGYLLWYRKADTAEYPTEPICKLVIPEREFLVSDLKPATKYMFKVVAFSNSSNLGMWEAGVTTGRTVEDDSRNLEVNGGTQELNYESPESNNGSHLSNPSEGYESNNATPYVDQDKFPKTSSGCSEKPNIIDLEKVFHSDTCIGVMHRRNEVADEEELPDHSASAAEEEPNSMILTDSHKDSIKPINLSQASDIPKSDKESNAPRGTEMAVIPYGRPAAMPPFTPSKLETLKVVERVGKSRPGVDGESSQFPKPEKSLRLGSSSMERMGRCEELCKRDGYLEGDYEYCVKVIRWLECKQHIETNFRVKFLTWFSLRATSQERRVVSVFVDTMIDDPPSLAEQLIDTFSEGIRGKPPQPLPTRFCTKLWH